MQSREKSEKTACIFNFPSHYREEIYLKMENDLNCDFYFGKYNNKGIRKINFDLFRNKITELETVKYKNSFNWIKGSLKIPFKDYKSFIITGEPYGISTWFFLIICKFLRKKTYLWTHGWYGDETKLKIVLKKTYYKLASGLFLYGNYAKDLMINEGFNEGNLHVIFNSLNYSSQLKVRKKLNSNNIYFNQFKNSNKNIFFIGRLTKVKKLDYLIKMIKYLNANNVQTNLTIIGDGEEKQKLINLAKEEKVLKYCWFYGSAYKEEEIGNLIYNSDLCVSPGNVGLTAIHSLMYGTPVLTHNNFSRQMPEFESINKGITGDFFIEDNIDSMNAKAEKWLVNDKVSRDDTRKKCFKVIDEKFNPNYQIEIFKKNIL